MGRAAESLRKSRFWMRSISSHPMPGQAKIVSIMTAPEIIMDVILNSVGDVGIETLKEKTGFQKP